MHRNDWEFGPADYVKQGDTAIIQRMCSGTVRKQAPWDQIPDSVKHRFGKNTRFFEPFVRDQNGRGWVEHNGDWHVYWWVEPCRFRDGHPGICGTKLPDIFLPNGEVKPSARRLLERRHHGSNEQKVGGLSRGSGQERPHTDREGRDKEVRGAGAQDSSPG